MDCNPTDREIVYYTRGLDGRPNAGSNSSSSRSRSSSSGDGSSSDASDCSSASSSACGSDSSRQRPAAAAPVLFLHGVGGLVIYTDLIHALTKLGGPVIAVDIRHVGMRLR
jgi:pimeloyl-ACP methyl ester carboxylesterase